MVRFGRVNLGQHFSEHWDGGQAGFMIFSRLFPSPCPASSALIQELEELGVSG